MMNWLLTRVPVVQLVLKAQVVILNWSLEYGCHVYGSCTTVVLGSEY